MGVVLVIMAIHMDMLDITTMASVMLKPLLRLSQRQMLTQLSSMVIPMLVLVIMAILDILDMPDITTMVSVKLKPLLRLSQRLRLIQHSSMVIMAILDILDMPDITTMASVKLKPHLKPHLKLRLILLFCMVSIHMLVLDIPMHLAMLVMAMVLALSSMDKHQTSENPSCSVKTQSFYSTRSSEQFQC